MFVFVIILSFIIRLRFRNKPITHVIKNRYGRDGLLWFRKLERTSLKVEKLRCDLNFLTTSQVNKLTPKFLRFKISLSSFMRDEDYRKYQNKLLLKEIELKRVQIIDFEKNYQEAYSKCQELFSSIDFNHIKSVTERTNEHKISITKSFHDRKLFRLGLLKKTEDLPPEKVIFNLSKIELSSIDKEALSLGCKFCFKPEKLNYTKFFLKFEKFFLQLSSH